MNHGCQIWIQMLSMLLSMIKQQSGREPGNNSSTFMTGGDKNGCSPPSPPRLKKTSALAPSVCFSGGTPWKQDYNAINTHRRHVWSHHTEVDFIHKDVNVKNLQRKQENPHGAETETVHLSSGGPTVSTSQEPAWEEKRDFTAGRSRMVNFLLADIYWVSCVWREL